ARRKFETVRGGREAGGVGHRRHLDRALGAVEERVEHLRIEVAGRDHLRRETVIGPHRVRRRRVILGKVLGALAGGDDLEALAAANERAAQRSAAQPVRASDARARSGARSAMPTMWMPGVCFACARYIAPNLPAPINPTVRGWPSAARCCSRRWRFMASAPAE